MMRKNYGFTLLEVLVVMVIIGIIATMTVLSVGSREPMTSVEARRLAELLRLATEEAVLSGQEWGLHLTNDGYEFMVLMGTTWQTADDDILRSRQFPQAIEPRLTLEGGDLAVDLPKIGEDDHDKKGAKSTVNEMTTSESTVPQILLLSSGEVSSFQIALYATEQPTYLVVGHYDGSFSSHPLKQAP